MKKTEQKSKKKKGNYLFKTIISILFVVAYVSLLLPTMLEQYSRIGQYSTVEQYQNNVSGLSDSELNEAWEKAAEYNQKIAEAQEYEPFYYDYYGYGEMGEDEDEEYDSLPLDTRDLCTIVIPNINVNLTVGHGTGDAMLQVEAGHLYGTSLPTGDSRNFGTIAPEYGTHTVIAAHTALRTAELFTRLEELETGDMMYIKILGETHAYEIDSIVTVLPEEANDYLQVQKGEDLLTLYTCTPYGINTHRLLVTGHRVADPIEDTTVSGVSGTLRTNKLIPMLCLGGLVLAPVIVIVLIWKKL